MNVKISTISAKFIIVSLVTVGILYATRLVELNHMLPEINYQEMSTVELEQKVERLSQNGELPFPMGLELMNRWSQR